MINLLAFDYGASSGRAIVGKYDSKRITLEEVHRFSNDPVQMGGSFYWDFLRLYFEMLKGLKKASSRSKLTSMGIDTWGVDFGLLDANGNLIGNPLHYRDSGTAGIMDEVLRIIPKEEIYKKTGIQFLHFNTLYQLYAIKIKNASFLDRASTLLFIPDLLRYFLTGERNSEFTVASTSQILNVNSSKWDNQLLDTLGIPVHFLTDIIASGTIGGNILPDVCSHYCIDSVPVVTVAEHDTASAVMAIPAKKNRFAYLSCGTWSLLGIESSEPIINADTYSLNFTNEGGFDNTVRVLKNIMGLWIYQECRREWLRAGENVSFDELEYAALKCTPFLSLIDPDDIAFYNPGNMPEKIKLYLKKTDQPALDKNSQIVRCIMESLALKYRMVLEELEQITGYQLPVLHVVGGGCKNRVLMQFTADSIGKPVVAGPTEATATGNIIAQLIASGEIKNLLEGRDVIRESFPETVFEPKNKNPWDMAYEKFLKLIERNKEVSI